MKKLSSILLFCGLALAYPATTTAENWPRWRGPDGNAVSGEKSLPVHWDTKKNVRWKTRIPGEGSSSPIIWNDRVFVTSAADGGETRHMHCLDRGTGAVLWTRTIEDDYPELTSALTGHAAATPVTGGEQVVAFFGNAGAVCYDFAGKRLWRRKFGYFDSELGLASSPVLYRDRVILLCDHDGNRFRNFDSFLIALDVKTGKTVWKTERRGLYRSWSTPILVPADGDATELVVNAQDELRGYDPQTGELLWQVEGMTGWVTPSPVFDGERIFATSGKDGPTLAVRPGGRGNVTNSHVIWKHNTGGPYVCSPLCYSGLLYVPHEQGVLTCYDAATGKVVYRRRLKGKFTTSAVAAEGRIYLTNEAGVTYVIQAGRAFEMLTENPLEEECLASPAVSDGCLFLRTKTQLYCVKAPE